MAGADSGFVSFVCQKKWAIILHFCVGVATGEAGDCKRSVIRSMANTKYRIFKKLMKTN